MNMPIPCDRMLINPTNFSDGYYPPIQLNLPQQLAMLVPRAASILLNMGQESAMSNAARMLAFNTLAVNNFQNPSYPQWVDFMLRLAAQKALSQNAPMNVVAFLGEAARDTLSMLASVVAVNNPQIHSMLQQNVLAAAYQNNTEFQKLSQVLGQLNLNVFNNVSSPMHNNYAPQYGNQQTPQYNAVPQQNTGGSMSPWAAGGPASVQVQQPPAQSQDSLKQNSWFNQQPQSNAAAPSVWSAPPTQPAPQPTAVAPVQQTIVPATLPTKPSSIVTIQGANEMDINVHAIPYFGSQEIVLDMSNRRSDLKMDALQSQREGRRPENSTDPVILNSVCGVELNLDTSIFVARVAAQNVRQKNRSQTIFRQFFQVLEPTPCIKDAVAGLQVFNSVSVLNQVGDSFRNFLKVFQDPSNPRDDEQEALNLYAYLDRRLARMVNNFLKYQLQESGVSIGSYASDIQQLYDFLKTRRNERAFQALQAWESRVLDMIRSGFTAEAAETLENFFSSEDAKEINYGFIAETVSVTVLNLTEVELGYTVGNNGSVIDPKTTGVLSDLVTGIFRNKKDLGFFTVTDIIVTADDARYRVTEQATSPGTYMLFKA